MGSEPTDLPEGERPVESADTIAAPKDVEAAGAKASDQAVAPTMTPDEATAPIVTRETWLAGTLTADRQAAGTGSVGPRSVELVAASLEERGYRERYAIDRLLGRGGMGEVHTCRDARIGREVAVKSMRHARAGEALARFVREARVQGQLEHPAIVPVYDIGVDPDGAPYFTMKRLRGMTLEQMLAGSLAEDAGEQQAYSLRRLLSVFTSVCQAMEFAHSRGVLHRDLKPSNVMLGDFGEVYLLDWGLARVAGAPEIAEGDAIGDDDDGLLGSGATEHGTVMGTPGYMAPEQLAGLTDAIDERSDVYALGAIFFEILTLQPLHDRGSAQALVDSTRQGADARASARAPARELAPELDAVCVRATAQEMSDRYSSVREMRETVERYLDGDRDLERRGQLAQEHADNAASAAIAALGDGGREARKLALREAGRALALDPENASAAATLTRLMLEPPQDVPPEVEEALAQSSLAASLEELRGGAFVYGAHFLSLPFLLWLGVKSWPLFGVMAAVVVVLGVWTWSVYKSGRMAASVVYAAAILNLALLVLMSRMFGPFILIPAIATVGTLGFLFHRSLVRPWIIVVIGCGAVIVPVLLEVFGVLEPTYYFSDGKMILDSPALALPRAATLVSLVAFTVTTILASAFFITGAREAQFRAERQVQMQAWQLRQLVPEGTHSRT